MLAATALSVSVAKTGERQRLASATKAIRDAKDKDSRGVLVAADDQMQQHHVGTKTYLSSGSSSKYQLVVRGPLVPDNYGILGASLGEAFETKASVFVCVQDVARYLVVNNKLPSEWTTEQLMKAIVHFAAVAIPEARKKKTAKSATK